MDQPVTNEACENRRCELRKLIRDEVKDVMATVNQNHTTTSDWLVRVEKKIDDSNTQLMDKIDGLRNMQTVLILALALGAIGVRLGWI